MTVFSPMNASTRVQPGSLCMERLVAGRKSYELPHDAKTKFEVPTPARSILF